MNMEQFFLKAGSLLNHETITIPVRKGLNKYIVQFNYIMGWAKFDGEHWEYHIFTVDEVRAVQSF